MTARAICAMRRAQRRAVRGITYGEVQMLALVVTVLGEDAARALVAAMPVADGPDAVAWAVAEAARTAAPARAAA
ncbi:MULTISPECIES: hypothetical protein [Roseomonadaceae]|uniref:Uncharacterized protein n=1 Tax=Falsiroseomonas oleicola TaxID=2801474 RepID=A0ABS6H795_9PROT|nr:hypothetical protein [Roseomonas oleicola]MBU8544319.1 hypothetical protein [Roseomonas oleicola]